MSTVQNETFARENDDLLVEEKAEPKDAKRNSKQELIQRILDLVKKNNIEIDYSDSKLKRMTKAQLQEVLGTVMEKIMQSQMADKLGCERNASEQVMAMAALKMIHNIAANGFEAGANYVGQDYGYTCEGFAKTLQQPIVSDAVDQCLQEIALENADLLEYVKSPYARLGLAWVGALSTCVRRKPKEIEVNNKRNVADMEARPPVAKNSDELRARGRPANGKVVRSI